MPGTSARSAVVPKEKEAGSLRRARDRGGRGGTWGIERLLAAYSTS
jgi:hypothetical protein